MKKKNVFSILLTVSVLMINTVITLAAGTTNPADSSNDYPVSKLTAIASNEYSPGTSNEGPARYILDGNANTHWHTKWTDDGTTIWNENELDRWVGVTLDQPTELAGVRYLPRTSGGGTGATNGFVEKYRLEYRESSTGQWKACGTGTLNRNNLGWKYLEFDQVVTAKSVRMIGVQTYTTENNGNGTNYHMSAAEFRVVMPVAEPVETGIEVTAVPAKTVYEFGEELDLTGLAVSKVFDDGSTEAVDVADCQISGYDGTKAGEQIITVVWGDFSSSFTVTVNEAAVQPSVEKDALQSLVSQAESLNAADYTEETWAAVQEALEAAKAVLADENATQEDVDAGNAALKAAVEALEEVKTPEEPDVRFLFDDVQDEDAFYYVPVYWAYDNNITNGVTSTLYAPDKDVIRADMVTFLWRAAGSPEPTNTECTFEDVDPEQYYYKAMLWAIENEITNGYNEKEFGTFDTCTRAQMVTFLWRNAKKPVPEPKACAFKDISAGAYYYHAVLWAVENNITNGLDETTFAPDNVCNRGQAVTFLYRFYNEA